MKVRDRLWRWLCRHRDAGELLSGRLLVARACLYPLDTAFWVLSKSRGYQPDTDTWLIHGIRFADSFFVNLSEPSPPGKWFRVVSRDGEVVYLEQRWDE